MSTRTGGRKPCVAGGLPNARCADKQEKEGLLAELAAEKEKNGGLGRRVAELEAQVAALQTAIVAIAKAQPAVPYGPYVAPPMPCQRGRGLCFCPACMAIGLPWTITGEGVAPLTVDGGVIPLTFDRTTTDGPIVYPPPPTCELVPRAPTGTTLGAVSFCGSLQ